jgi:hypothetical protein
MAGRRSWPALLLACGGLLGGSGPLHAQAYIVPETLRVEIGERLARHEFYVDFSGLTRDAAAVRWTIPAGFDVDALGHARDSVRACGIAGRQKDSTTGILTVEWRRPNWITGPWQGFPKCLMGLRLTDVHGRVARFQVDVVGPDGAVRRAAEARITILGPGRSRWWIWGIAIAMLLLVTLWLRRARSPST